MFDRQYEWFKSTKNRMKLFLPGMVVWVVSLVLQNVVGNGYTLAFALVMTLYMVSLGIISVFANAREQEEWIKKNMNP